MSDLVSIPTASATSLISAPVDSHIAEIELIELILCARKALAVSLLNSELHKFVFKILLGSTQFK